MIRSREPESASLAMITARASRAIRSRSSEDEPPPIEGPAAEPSCPPANRRVLGMIRRLLFGGGGRNLLENLVDVEVRFS